MFALKMARIVLNRSEDLLYVSLAIDRNKLCNLGIAIVISVHHYLLELSFESELQQCELKFGNDKVRNPADHNVVQIDLSS